MCASHKCVLGGGGGGGGRARARERTGVVALPPLRPLKPRTFGIITMQLALHGSLATPRKTNAALLRESELKFGVKHCVSCSKSSTNHTFRILSHQLKTKVTKVTKPQACSAHRHNVKNSPPSAHDTCFNRYVKD